MMQFKNKKVCMKHFFKLFYRGLGKFVYFRNPVKYARKIEVTVGKGASFVDFSSYSSELWLINIGDSVSISSDVSFVTHYGCRWGLAHLFPSEVPYYLSFASNLRPPYS